MLQDIRQNVQGPFIKVIVWLIVIAFAAFGIESILLGGGSSGVAEVNGEEISPYEVQQLVNTQKRRLISMMGENIDPTLLDDDRLTAQAIETLIARKLLLQSADDMGLAISEKELGATVAAMEQFQLDGQFSAEVYKGLLSEAGFTPASFKQGLREDLLGMQVRSALGAAEFVTPAELALNARIADEQRDLRYVTIPLDGFRQAVEIDETDLSAFYEANQQQFLSPETVDIDYLQVGVDQFRQPVTEAQLQEEYEQARKDYQYRTQNRVSHILFEEGEGGEAELQQRIAEARKLLDEGVSFADVATRMSDDVGSSAQGGDLGFSLGDTFPEEMEKVIADLELNTVSEPVVTDAGTHLIMVTERQEAEAPGLEEMRADLTDRIQLSQARADLLVAIEELKDISFNALDLDGPARELGLEVSRSDGITRTQQQGLFANPALLEAIWSEDVLLSGHNSEVIELSGDRFIVLRVREHHEPQIRPLSEVREEIRSTLTEQKAREAQTAQAESALTELRAGTRVEEYARTNGYEWQVALGVDRSNETVPPALLRRVFQLPAPAAGESLFDYVREPTGDLQVFELDRVTPGDLDQMAPVARTALARRLRSETGTLVLEEYQRGLRDDADISVM